MEQSLCSANARSIERMMCCCMSKGRYDVLLHAVKRLRARMYCKEQESLAAAYVAERLVR